jgi:CopA family copper-resistance protein
MTFFDVRIPDLRMTVVAADGQDVLPVPVDEFRIGIGETYDVIVNPRADRAFTVMAEPIDRSGHVSGTLAPRDGMRGVVPPLRPRAILSMADMGPMEGMDHGPGHAAGHAAGHAVGHGATAAGGHAAHHGGAAGAPPTDGSGVASGAPLIGWASAGTPPGQKALRYEDLKSLVVNTDTRAPTHEIRMVLDGQMHRYNWTLNGRRFDQAEPIRVQYNARVRIRFVNTTMMAHPMHLHGMFVELENGQTTRMPRKHVVIVRPGSEASVILTANEPGDWPFHCHLLYHMNAGMMTRFVVEPPRRTAFVQ